MTECKFQQDVGFLLHTEMLSRTCTLLALRMTTEDQRYLGEASTLLWWITRKMPLLKYYPPPFLYYNIQPVFSLFDSKHDKTMSHAGVHEQIYASGNAYYRWNNHLKNL